MKAARISEACEDIRKEPYDFTINGTCSGCGNCCSNLLPMTDEEVRIIKKYIKKHRIPEQKHLLPLAAPAIDLTCPFLDCGKKTEKCVIYEVRPKICRDFICTKGQRAEPDLKYLMKTKVRNVREEFFSKNSIN